VHSGAEAALGLGVRDRINAFIRQQIIKSFFDKINAFIRQQIIKSFFTL
jgi:hypothetical protein